MSKNVSKDEALKAVKTITDEISKSSLEKEALEAVKTLILWAGDDPEREGLVDTPKRVVKAYKEFFSGYEEDPEEILSRTFEEVEGYDDAVIVRNIRVESHCEHHMVPIVGVAHIGYIPRKRVVGISKLARLVDLFGKRLQTQETMTAQIADTIDKVLQPKGVAVVIDLWIIPVSSQKFLLFSLLVQRVESSCLKKLALLLTSSFHQPMKI